MPDNVLKDEATAVLRETTVRLVDNAGLGVTGMGGVATIKVAKAGANFVASGAGTSLTEITGGSGAAPGVYRLRLGAGDSDTVGDVPVEITNAAIVDTYAVVTIRPASRTVDYADAFLTSAKLADDAITAAKIAASAITSAKLAADAITAAKVASDVGAEIAAATWDLADMGSHRVAGSFGELAQVVLGLLHGNAMVDNTIFGTVQTSARLRIFATPGALSAATAGNANDVDEEVFRFTITAVDSGGGHYSSFKVHRDL